MTTDPSRALLGRRIEADGLWTAYHVFTGVPAIIDKTPMVGLSRAEATTVMLFNNRCYRFSSSACVPAGAPISAANAM